MKPGIIQSVLTACLLLGAFMAMPAPPPEKEYASAAEVSALIAKAKRERKDGQPIVSEPLVELGRYDGHLEYRASVGPAAVHEKEAELFCVIEGSATLVMGGRLNEPRRTDSENLLGSAIEGGNVRRIASGDWILVPHNTPHWFSRIDTALVLFSLHVPAP